MIKRIYNEPLKRYPFICISMDLIFLILFSIRNEGKEYPKRIILWMIL